MSITTSVCLSLLLSNPNHTPIRNWEGATSATRAANLGLELKKISPPSEQKIHHLDQHSQLVALSAQNLERLKMDIEERRPLAPSAAQNTEAMAQVRAMSAELEFYYLRENPYKEDPRHFAPLVSDRELVRLNPDRDISFYSSLVGNTSSVSFGILAAKAKVGPLALNATAPTTALRLDNQFAASSGFVIPHFKNVSDLLGFFQEWEPELMGQVLRDNRNSLPSDINTVEKLTAYLQPNRINQIFPDHALYDRLAALRERLHRYVLTERDARHLLLWAFERYLLTVATEDPQLFLHVQSEFRLAGGPQNIFAMEFRPYLGLPQLTVRIPYSVPTRAYSVLTIENAAYNPFPDWDSRRLDPPSNP